MTGPVFVGDFEPGVCQCGCGRTTATATKTYAARGIQKGVPLRYVHGHSGGRTPMNVAERLWSNVAIGDPEACWLWTGLTNKGGYGKFWLAGRTLGAHRVVVSLELGPIEDSLVVRHRCDNPPCCNPSHLLLGTHQQNMDDRTERGRVLRGEAVGNAVLTVSDVLAIRRCNADGETQVSLARRFGVARSTVHWVIRERTWKHVGGAA